MDSYKVPILPDKPSKALLGKEITQEMIDGALAYNPKFRPSYIYLDKNSAHGANGDTLAKISKTFIENGEVVAEVIPNRKYRGEKFEEFAAEDGTHPGRSVDLWPKELVPDCSSDYYLVGIALCGATMPAVRSLSAIYYSAETQRGILEFALNLKPTHGDETMPDDQKPDQKVDFAAVQKQLNDQKTQIEQLSTDVKTLAAERDHYKTESEKLANGYKDLKTKADKQEVEMLLDSADYVGKVKSEERDSIIELALSLKTDAVQLSANKSRYDAYMESIKNRPVMVELTVHGRNLPNSISPSEPLTINAAIQKFAAENGINIYKDRAEWTKAEDGAMKKYPAAFGIKEGVR